MKRHDKEFKIGDLVTFNAYGKSLPAKVLAVDVPVVFKQDERVFYHLYNAGIVETKCTGLCIKESKYYEECKP